MLRQVLPAAALFGAAFLAGCAQTGTTPPAAATEVPAETGPFRPFADDSVWNTKIPQDAKIDPNSDVLTAQFLDLNPLHINIQEWSVAVYPVDAKTKRRYVQALYPNQYGRGFGPRIQIPIPEGASPAGPDLGTGYIVLEDRKAGKAWEMRQAGQNPDGGWFAGFGATVDLNGSGVNRPWMTEANRLMSGSPRPSGAPLVAGLIRVDELKAGQIDHALAFAYPKARMDVFVSPASDALTSRTPSVSGTGLPLGARIQLNPDYDIDDTKLSPEAKTIARALQTYGAILVDQAAGTVLYAEASPDKVAEWNGLLDNDELYLLFTPEFMSKNFRVLDLGETMPGQPHELP